jgi:hypothetical protein
LFSYITTLPLEKQLFTLFSQSLRLPLNFVRYDGQGDCSVIQAIALAVSS